MRIEAQAFVRTYLAGKLTADVRATVPNPRPSPFVYVKREGGGRLDRHRDRPGIGIFCWAETEAKAASLAMEVSEAMQGLELEKGVAKVTEEIIYSAPDPEDKTPRWYGSYTLTTY